MASIIYLPSLLVWENVSHDLSALIEFRYIGSTFRHLVWLAYHALLSLCYLHVSPSSKVYQENYIRLLSMIKSIKCDSSLTENSINQLLWIHLNNVYLCTFLTKRGWSPCFVAAVFSIHFEISIKVISIFNKSTFPLFFVKRKSLVFNCTGRRRESVDGLNTNKNDVIAQ